ncbi:MAG: hypothetical protein CL677_08575 [Bdellovibrionaceae bacterium]|nr:hypothetical protein [Pseudobdellovibrionaceae bacterium]|tara:strand:+ start:731 stop:1087 length:357 start_codon:yes stop_codon:yes gene_type:complete
MRIVRASQVKNEERSYGRTVKRLLDLENFDADSLVLYLGQSPQGKLDCHYHSESHEIICFPIGGKLIVNNESFDFEAWDLVVLEPGDTHGYESNDGSETIHLAIKLPGTPDKVAVKSE